MPRLSMEIVSHKFSIHPSFSPMKQKTQKFNPDLSLRIKDEVSKQIESNVIEVTKYPTWLANIVPVLKKDGKIRICVDYRDLNKASPKDNFPLPNISILIDNCAKHELQLLVDCFTGYHQILTDKEDVEKTAFITPWGVYHYRKFFDRLRRYNLKLNPAKYAFGIPAGKLLGFIVSRRGIELDPSKIKLLRKYAPTEWTEQCQKAFDKIKDYLSNPPVLVPPRPDIPLLLYLSVLDNAFGWVFGQHDEIGKLAKWQMLLSDFDIVCMTQKSVKGQALADHLAENPVDEEYEPLRTYFPNEEVLLVSEYIAESYPGWRMFFDGAVNFKGSGIGAVLVSESGQHYPVAAKLRFKCTNNIAEYKACIMGLRLALDMNIQELLVIGDSDLLIHQVQREWATKNAKILPYLHLAQKQCKRFRKIGFKHTLRIQNKFDDVLATISSMIQHPEKSYIDPLEISLKEQHAYCS
ncbi:uncharacterized protein LOC132601631 [Lycium barbarum]|uniref:uncharacterized protein LOC132601631 n=1 Tax=Lycium barbarum TaxID=112863 RepID=UPI00293E944C|nr:uncharacterized protein LOC132601631 [Lycium barbarum]